MLVPNIGQATRYPFSPASGEKHKKEDERHERRDDVAQEAFPGDELLEDDAAQPRADVQGVINDVEGEQGEGEREDGIDPQKARYFRDPVGVDHVGIGFQRGILPAEDR